MKKYKLCETKKLHYGKYLYKLVLWTSLSNIFRTGFQKSDDLAYARHKLDELTSLYRANKALTITYYRTAKEIPVEDYLDAMDIYSSLKKETDFKIRVENVHLYIYSNDKNMLQNLHSKIRSTNWTEFWEPKEENLATLLSGDNVIFVNTPPQFPLRITFNGKTVPKEFADWLKNNTDKSKVGPKTLESIEHHRWSDGNYFHVRDEKVLNLIYLIIGNNIRRIDKLVYRADIDK